MASLIFRNALSALFSAPKGEKHGPIESTSKRPVLAIVAVMLGACIATLSGRLSIIGIADLRGVLHAGVDEGAWIPTAQFAGQMLIGPTSVWAASVFGHRRVMLWATALFCFATAVTPMATSVPFFVFAQFSAGLGAGCFIPLAVLLVRRNLPPWLWPIGIAIYAINLEVSTNVAASIAGWYIDHAFWGLIYWQCIPLALGMAYAILRGVPAQAPDRNALANPDIFGIVTCGAASTLFYLALDQGNRLDWLNSELICGLLIGGCGLAIAFVVNELTRTDPWIDFSAFVHPSFALFLLLFVLRCSLLATGYLIPQYLSTVRGFRSLDVGSVLIWLAVPQVVIAPVVAVLLRLVDTRLLTAAGLVSISLACLSNAHGLTAAWGLREFLPTQLMQALGQALAISSVVYMLVLYTPTKPALALGAMFQVVRILGGEIGTAFIATWVRMREQVSSAIIGAHLTTSSLTNPHQFSLRGLPLLSDSSHMRLEALALLAGRIRSQSCVEAYIEGSFVVGFFLLSSLLILLRFKPAPPGPASPIKWRIFLERSA